MLKMRVRRQIRRRVDWFPAKVYRHFDHPLCRSDAEVLVHNFNKNTSHSFLPLLTFQKKERRFRSGENGPVVSTKTRALAYSSNRDNCLYSYYASMLSDAYEGYIKASKIDHVVLAYRTGGSNITHAAAAFEEIRSRGFCAAITFDITKFFDSIDHAVLKSNWSRVLGVTHLPEDHYKIFRSITAFATVEKSKCLERLGFHPRTADKDLPRPLCTIEDFRNKVRGDDGTCSNLVETNRKSFGIPQGTAISALAANISMIGIDLELARISHRV